MRERREVGRLSDLAGVDYCYCDVSSLRIYDALTSQRRHASQIAGRRRRSISRLPHEWGAVTTQAACPLPMPPDADQKRLLSKRSATPSLEVPFTRTVSVLVIYDKMQVNVSGYDWSFIRCNKAVNRGSDLIGSSIGSTFR